MGEMADYHGEIEYDHEWDGDEEAWSAGTDGGNPFEPDDAVSLIFQLSDDELRRMSADATHHKIVGIREWPRELSPKQRWCLAFWIAKRSVRS